MIKKNIVIFGSTGSIGCTLVEILKKDRKRFNVKLLTCNKNIKILLKQVKVFNVKNIVITDKKCFINIKKILDNTNIKIYNNFKEVNKIFKNEKVDYLMNAISGIDGLEPTLNLIKYCKNIAIANKESIICGWNLIE